MIEFDPTITASVGLSLITGGFAWFRTRRQDVDDRFDAGTKRMNEHATRLLALETEIKAMPGRDDIHNLELKLTEMVGSMNTMAASMEGQKQIWARVETMVDRHDQHLLDGGK